MALRSKLPQVADRRAQVGWGPKTRGPPRLHLQASSGQHQKQCSGNRHKGVESDRPLENRDITTAAGSTDLHRRRHAVAGIGPNGQGDEGNDDDLIVEVAAEGEWRPAAQRPEELR